MDGEERNRVALEPHRLRHYLLRRLVPQRQSQRREQRRERIRQQFGNAASPVFPSLSRCLPFERRAWFGQRGHRPRLHNKDPPMAHGPFDVHRLAVELLDLHAQPCQFRGLCRLQRGSFALVDWDRLFARTFMQSHRHDFFAGDFLRCNCPRLLLDDDRVRCNTAADDRFAHAPCCVDHQFVARARHGIHGEDHACGFGQNKLLHDDGDAYVFGSNPLSLAVTDGAPRPQRGPAPPDRIDHLIAAAHVEVRFQLARE